MDGSAGATYSTPTDALLSPVFLDAMRWIIDTAEGGGKLIKDQGGTTRWGISQNAYPGLDIAQLSREEAEKLYLRDYWKPIRGNALPPAIALLLFDASVNHGPRQAIKLLQAALKVKQDGIMGPETVGAAKTYPRSELIVRFLYCRDMFYELIAQRPEHAASLYGWKLRLWRLALQAGLWKAL
mgnify:CR=1 FL=1